MSLLQPCSLTFVSFRPLPPPPHHRPVLCHNLSIWRAMNALPLCTLNICTRGLNHELTGKFVARDVPCSTTLHTWTQKCQCECSVKYSNQQLTPESCQTSGCRVTRQVSSVSCVIDWFLDYLKALFQPDVLYSVDRQSHFESGRIAKKNRSGIFDGITSDFIVKIFNCGVF
jgi:hypothetical protein